MTWRAASGLRSWVIQRLSAVYLAAFIVYLLFAFLVGNAASFERWQAWVSHPVNNILLGLFVIAIMLHAWVGVRDVIMDYVKPYALRFVVLAVFAGGFIAMVVWSFKVLIVGV